MMGMPSSFLPTCRQSDMTIRLALAFVLDRSEERTGLRFAGRGGTEQVRSLRGAQQSRRLAEIGWIVQVAAVDVVSGQNTNLVCRAPQSCCVASELLCQ